MSKWFYSPSVKGFYSEEIHGGAIPADAVEISNSAREELLEAQSTGLEIAWDDVEQAPVAKERVVTIEQARRFKRQEINDAADAALRSVTDIYPRTEIDSWTVQTAEAEAYDADSNAATPFIDALLTRRPGVDKPTLVGRIIANASAYKALSADVFGQRQALDDLVDAAQTVAAVQAIVVSIDAAP